MYRIFIVEDDEIIARSIRKHLERWDYEASVAGNFANIIEEFLRFAPQLVLMDVKLPFYNGYHWCAEIRKISKVPVIFLFSAADNMNIVEREYQKLLHISLAEKVRQENEALRQQRDMREYYAMWAHQIKTPIFALKLLLEEHQEDGERNEELEELFCIEQYVEMALQYVRLESETTDFLMEHVALDGLIRSAIRKYARLFLL